MTTEPTEQEKADAARDYLIRQSRRHAEIAADELDALASWATNLARSVRFAPTAGYTTHGGSSYLTKVTERLAKADALFTLTEKD